MSLKKSEMAIDKYFLKVRDCASQDSEKQSIIVLRGNGDICQRSFCVGPQEKNNWREGRKNIFSLNNNSVRARNG